jgi:hypothetical protein
MAVNKFNRGEADPNVMYDILVAHGEFSDSEQRAIESRNTTYLANETAHLWHDPKKAAPAPVPAPAPKAQATPPHEVPAPAPKASTP